MYITQTFSLVEMNIIDNFVIVLLLLISSFFSKSALIDRMSSVADRIREDRITDFLFISGHFLFLDHLIINCIVV